MPDQAARGGSELRGWLPPGGPDTVVTRGDAFCERVVAGMHVNLWDDGITPVQNLIRSGVCG